ncbi:MAG TPA: FecR domain-containing protein [Terracidiphilus sp.]|nr:FecR domain-containing protein [Terracidiphilus sp.]
MNPIGITLALNPRRVTIAAALGLALLMTTGSVRAADAGWLIVGTEGEVQIEGPGGAWMPVSASNVVQPGSMLKTGHNGRVTVEHDGDRLVISPNSQLELPVAETAMPTAEQTVGTVLYNMVPRGIDRFQVKTPYLAAVIKGTIFTVTVSDQGAAVHVARGIVQCRSIDGQNATLVFPGQTAVVPAGPKGELHLIGRGATPGNGAKPAGDKSGTRAENAIDGLKSVPMDGHAPMIGGKIEPHAEGIAALTQGLIPNAAMPGPFGGSAANDQASAIGNNGNGNGNAGDNGKGNGNAGANANENENGYGNGNGIGKNVAIAASAVGGNASAAASNAAAAAALGKSKGNDNGNGNGNGKGKN